MASGKFYITRTSGSTYLKFRVDWSSTTNGILENSSNVRVKVTVEKSGSSTEATYGTANTTVNVGSASQSVNGKSFSVSPASEVLLFDKTYKNILHNSDGSKSVTIKVNVGGNVMGASGSENVTLDSIARRAYITNCSDFTDEDNPLLEFYNPVTSGVDSVSVAISLDKTKADVPYRNVELTDTSYRFNLTDAERKTLRKATTGSNSRTVYFYVRTIINGEPLYDSQPKKFTVVDCQPTLAPVAYDTNSYTTPLTGDNTRLIKNMSQLYYSANPEAKKEATITNVKVECGARALNFQAGTSANGTIPEVDSDTIKFTATDSRGNKVSQSIKLTLLDYTKVTCNMNVDVPTADGKTTVYVDGNFFATPFGVVTNALTVKYRIQENSGEFGEWLDVATDSITFDTTNKKYSARIAVSGLDYRSAYTFQALAFDNVMGLESNTKKVKTIPVFEWSETDFTFNVPVEAKEGIYVQNSLGEQGTINNIASIISEAVQLSTTGTTAGSNWTLNSFSAVLVGNNIRCSYSAKRSPASGTGNVTNETVLNVVIKHSGRVKDVFVNSFSSGGTGHIATFNIVKTGFDSEDINLRIDLAATGGTVTDSAGYFLLPVTRDITIQNIQGVNDGVLSIDY